MNGYADDPAKTAESMRDGYEDWDFNIRMAAAGYCAIEIAKPLYIYRVSNEGMLLSHCSSRHAAIWRGIGLIPGSGLAMREEYARFDAWRRFDLSLPDVPEIKGCQCGDVLKGRIRPDQCVLFGRACTPARPVGPCMVSTEGSCAAYFQYNPAGRSSSGQGEQPCR